MSDVAVIKQVDLRAWFSSDEQRWEFMQRQMQRESAALPLHVLREMAAMDGTVLSDKGRARARIPDDVRAIIAKVANTPWARRVEAILELTEQYDGVRLTPDQLLVPRERIVAARAAADKKFLRLVRRVRRNIERYQKRIMVKAPRPIRRRGRELGVRYTPVDRVGVYVPGGRAFYPSTVLMTVVPAQVAGVKDIAIASPPSKDGDVHPMVLALAGELGVKEVYRIGGAQAIAAMALGAVGIPRVSKIVGPGNAYVAEAKRQLFGVVGIDSIAGPSEVLIIADETASPDWVAADMLAQAEHDPGWAILITTSDALAKRVTESIASQLSVLRRAQATERALREDSCIVLVDDIPQACWVANRFAAEHLQIIVAPEREEEALAAIHHAGAIFIGPNTPVPLGDYVAGPSHVLPTGGTARFFGPLSCNDFLKASSVVRYDAAALAEDAQDVIDFATCEGLTAHAEAVRIRTKKP